MSKIDYGRVFSCPRCGIQGSIYVLKVSGALIIIKQRCPQHGGKAFKLPLAQRNQYEEGNYNPKGNIFLVFDRNAIPRNIKIRTEIKNDKSGSISIPEIKLEKSSERYK